jgi:hypothetical protein
MTDDRQGARYSRKRLEESFEGAVNRAVHWAGLGLAPVLRLSDRAFAGPIPPRARATVAGHCIAATAHRSTPEREFLPHAITSLLGQPSTLSFAVFVDGPIPASVVADQLRGFEALAPMTIEVIPEADTARFVLEPGNRIACIDATIKGNPWRLTWAHKALFRELVLKHDVFRHATHLIYSEDDMAFPSGALDYWCTYRAPLAGYRLLPGFLRVEGPEHDRCVTGWRRRSDRRPRVGVRRSVGDSAPDEIVWFVNLNIPYQAMYILDAELAEWHFRRSDFRSYRRSKLSPAFGGRWGVPERAAAGPIFDEAVPTGYRSRNVFPLIAAADGRAAVPLPESLIHHLPWKDYNNPNVPQGKARVRDSFVLDPAPTAAELARVINTSA